MLPRELDNEAKGYSDQGSIGSGSIPAELSEIPSNCYF